MCPGGPPSLPCGNGLTYDQNPSNPGGRGQYPQTASRVGFPADLVMEPEQFAAVCQVLLVGTNLPARMLEDAGLVPAHVREAKRLAFQLRASPRRCSSSTCVSSPRTGSSTARCRRGSSTRSPSRGPRSTRHSRGSGRGAAGASSSSAPKPSPRTRQGDTAGVTSSGEGAAAHNPRGHRPHSPGRDGNSAGRGFVATPAPHPGDRGMRSRILPEPGPPPLTSTPGQGFFSAAVISPDAELFSSLGEPPGRTCRPALRRSAFGLSCRRSSTRS